MDYQLNLSVDWPVQFSILLGSPVHGKSKWFFVIWNQTCIKNDRFNNREAMFHLKAGLNQEIANLLQPSKSLIIQGGIPGPPPLNDSPDLPTHTPEWCPLLIIVFLQFEVSYCLMSILFFQRNVIIFTSYVFFSKTIFF